MNTYEIKFFIYIALSSLFILNLDIATNTAIIRTLRQYSTLEKFKLLVLMWIHAIVWIIVFSGIVLSLLNLTGFHKGTRIIYLICFIVSVAVTIQWFIFNNRCVLTLELNQMLNIHKDCEYRTPFMVLSNTNTDKLSMDTKFKDYIINFISIFMLAFILWNQR